MDETKDLQDPEIASTRRPVVLEFSAGYCPPCRQLEPIIERLAETYRGAVEVIAIDIEARPDLAQRWGVRAVPTLLALRRGEVVAHKIGFSRAREVEELFAELAAEAAS